MRILETYLGPSLPMYSITQQISPHPRQNIMKVMTDKTTTTIVTLHHTGGKAPGKIPIIRIE